MIILGIQELVPGMLVNESVYIDSTDKVLLAKGTKLTSKLIILLKNRGIIHVAITERYTLDVDPLDVVQNEINYPRLKWRAC